jgi:hypothetical protein
MVYLEDLEETAYPELERRIKDRRYVSGTQLAAGLRANREKKIPDLLFDYLCRFLEGKIRKKPGPSRKSELVEVVTLVLARIAYEKYLKEEKLKQKREGASRRSKGGAVIPPHEIAAGKVKAEFYRHVDYRHVMNLLSRKKSSARSKP